MNLKIIMFTLLAFVANLHAITKQKMKTIFSDIHPFSYNLGVTILPSKKTDTDIMICCHGYGSSSRIGNAVHSWRVTNDHIVSFNFPDYGLNPKTYDHSKSSFGTIQELLPALYIIKKCVVEGNQSRINLYGFSAGGGAIINLLAVLNQSTYDTDLKKVGITIKEKKQIINALQAGTIILDCPLKSIDEIVDHRGRSAELVAIANQYIKNNMRPIDTIQHLKGLSLTILLNFQKPDEVLSNRDDHNFIERLQKVNNGKTHVVTSHDGGHTSFHKTLWEQYNKLRP